MMEKKKDTRSGIGKGGAATRYMQRAKSLENHAVKERIRKEKELGGILTCAECGGPMRASYKASGDKAYYHMFVETAAKAGIHLPLFKEDNDQA